MAIGICTCLSSMFQQMLQLLYSATQQQSCSWTSYPAGRGSEKTRHCDKVKTCEALMWAKLFTAWLLQCTHLCWGWPQMCQPCGAMQWSRQGNDSRERSDYVGAVTGLTEDHHGQQSWSWKVVYCRRVIYCSILGQMLSSIEEKRREANHWAAV